MNVEKEAKKKFSLSHFIPSIIAKWTLNRPQTVWMHQDNAPEHFPADETDVFAAEDKWRTFDRLVAKPFNSRDFNVCDLRLFS